MAIQEGGRDLWAKALSSANNGAAGTVSSFPSATKVKVTGAGWTVNVFAGQDVVVEGVVGTIVENTNEELTIARWETPGSRGGATATTPAGTPKFVISGGQAPALWMALSTNTSSPVVGGTGTATSFEGEEIKTASGGLIRKVATFEHTAGTSTYTVKATFTVNNLDTVPVKVAKIGLFNAQKKGILLYETLLSSTAELKAEGDQVTVTDTVSGT